MSDDKSTETDDTEQPPPTKENAERGSANGSSVPQTNDASLADAVLDNLTDIVAVVAIGTILIYHGSPTDATLAAIVSIALGKRYLGSK